MKICLVICNSSRKVGNSPLSFVPNSAFGIYPANNRLILKAMSYCTTQHITDRKGTRQIAELTGDNTGQTVNESTLQGAIDSFAERINSALRHEYPSLPFGDEQLQLRDLNIEGAYLLLQRDSPRGWTEDMMKQWKLLLDDLDSIATGRIKLQTLDSRSLEKKTDGFFSSNRRLFRRNSLPNVEGLYE